MSVLDNFSSIFNDLEKSYHSMKESLKVDNRNDFLKKICFDDDGISILPQIKVALSKEVKDYDQEQLHLHSLIVEIIDSISFILSSKILDLNEDKIEDLNKILLMSVREKSRAIVEKNLDLDELYKSFKYEKEPRELSAKELFIKYGEVDSFSKKFNGKIVTVRLKQNYSDTLLAINPETLEEMAKEGDGTFQSRAIDTLTNLNKPLAPMGSCAVCSRDLLIDGTILGRTIRETKDEGIVSYKGCTIYMVD